MKRRNKKQTSKYKDWMVKLLVTRAQNKKRKQRWVTQKYRNQIAFNLDTCCCWLCRWRVTMSLNAATNKPIVRLSFSPHMIYAYGEPRWNDTDRGKPKNSEEKTCPSATLSTTNPTWTDHGAIPDLCGQRPMTNRLSHARSNLNTL
jgi:hypothetical protein